MLTIVEAMTPSVVIGRAVGPEDDFVFPMMVGKDRDGSIYILDARLNELRRFSAQGVFERLVAKRGNGPGELSAQVGILVDSLTVGVWNGRTGHYTTLSRDGQVLGEQLLPLRSGNRQPRSPLKVSETGEITFIAIDEQAPADPRSPRSDQRVSFLRLGPKADQPDTLYSYVRPSSSLRFHGGRTWVTDPGPQTGDIAIYDYQANEVIRIHRPVSETGAEAVFTVERVRPGEGILTQRSYAVPAAPIPATRRDSFKQQVSGIVGRFSSTDEVDYVGWPNHYPAVESATLGRRPDRQLWLKLSSMAAVTTWIVLDEDLNPVAALRLPVGLRFERIVDGVIYGTREDEDGALVVVGYRLPNTAARD